MTLPLMRALGLLQRYPFTLLLPAVVIVAAGIAIDAVPDGRSLSDFSQFLAAIAALSIKFVLFCLAFLCVANYAVRSESNGEAPEIRNMACALKYPGCSKLLAGLLARFALTIVSAFALAIVLVPATSRIFKVSTHHSVLRLITQSHAWVAIALGILILSRWILVIPLFVQSAGLLKPIFSTSAKTIQGRRAFVVLTTLLVEAISHPFLRLTAPLHPRLSEGAARFVPHLLELIAAHGLQAALWTYWMLVMTMLAMRLQSADEPLEMLPLETA